MISRRAASKLLVAGSLLVAASGCSDALHSNEKVRRIIYWEKWTGFEDEAMDRVVDAFNAKEQARARSEAGYVPIEVQKVTISRIEQKLLVSVAGGNPPDVAGVFSMMVPAYADKGALTDLGPMAKQAGIERSQYVGHYYDLGVYRKKLWGLPTTPASIALHWNKRMFREAGLDPSSAPRTIEELDAFAEKLTKWEVTLPDGSKQIRSGYLPDVPLSQKRLLQVGFLPSEPGWWSYAWGYFFGGDLMAGDKVTANSPENVRAYDWLASYTRKLGVDSVQRFRSGFGNFASPQNPFLSGKVAMVLQGVWMYNFIEQYAPGMQWGAAAFPPPADKPDLPPVTNADADALVIPKDSKHPAEAFEFIRFVQTRDAMELLCLGQRKFSPLATVSPGFWEKHPHPYIRLFSELASSQGAFAAPKVGVWNEYAREIGSAVDMIQNLSRAPGAALSEVQVRVQAAFDRNRRITQRRGE